MVGLEPRLKALETNLEELELELKLEIERLKTHMDDAVKRYQELALLVTSGGGESGTESASQTQRLEE